jgi:hypothetical protein
MCSRSVRIRDLKGTCVFIREVFVSERYRETFRLWINENLTLNYSSRLAVRHEIAPEFGLH